MPNDFTGLVDLLDGDGAVVDSEVHAALNKRRTGGLWQWSGQLGPHHDQQDWDPVSQVRLPSGELGTVILTEVNIRTDPFGLNKTGWVTGSGPPPF